MKRILNLFFLVVFVSIYAQTSTENYVYSKTNLSKPGDPVQKQAENVTYFDGLGRPKENIAVKASPTGKDMVTPVVYDDFGRQTLDILPVPIATKSGGIHPNITEADANTYYSGLGLGGTAFSEKKLENSPLDRILQQANPGDPWKMSDGKTTKFDYQGNSKTDDTVQRYIFTTTWGTDKATSHGLPSGTLYEDSQLYKNVVVDEDGNVSIEFKNGEGQTVLVRKMLTSTSSADTYYLYDDFNQLAYVIPPLAAAKAVISQTDLDNLCYQYRYDGRSRLVEKKLPGKGWEYMVYDQQDRLVLTQDANLRTSTNNFLNRGWLFTKYDKFGRVVYSGFFKNTAPRSSMQTALDNMSANAGNNEERLTSPSITLQGLPLYYTKNAFPTGSMTLLSVNYYDSYPTGAPAFDNILAQSPTPNLLTATYTTDGRSTKSLTVASFVKDIEDDAWTKNYTFYDTKARAFASYSFNHLGGYTKTESELDFAGVPQRTYSFHKRLSSDTDEVQIRERFAYNTFNNALEKHWHQVGTQPEELLTENTYNEIGQLSIKKVGNNIQQMDYSYNIRGWMTSINNPKNLNGRLFGYSINYQSPLEITNTSPYIADPSLKVETKYNGNISEVTWASGSTANPVLKKYGYVYDNLNRLRAGFYYAGLQYTYTEENNEIPDYDLNGNIKHLKRTANLVQGTGSMIDDLTYNYVGNQLMNITDAANNTSGYEGGGNAITYDPNGNMTSMSDKEISAISYNYLNLPNKITINNYFSPQDISAIYRADGTKIQKTTTSIGENFSYQSTILDYLDGFQYIEKINGGGLDNGLQRAPAATDFAMEQEAFQIEDPELGPPQPSSPQPTEPTFELQFFPTAEGYYDYKKNQYIYQYKDHLGNVRLSFTKNSTGALDVTDENDFYPFGMSFLNPTAPSNFASGAYQNYKYNGKELQETGMYDYGARMYMPDIGRWGVLDPKSELLESSSPYVYALNSPILYLDKDGELPILINGRVGSDSERANSSYWSKEIINTIRGSGIANPHSNSADEFQYVDGDRYLMQDFSGNWNMHNGSYVWGNSPGWRYEAGKHAMDASEFNTILSKLAKDPKTGKIIEKIQIYTHSRGAAFGQGYTERLVEMIKDNSDLFADAANEVEFSYNMAPNESWGTSAVKGVPTYTQDHDKDWLSGNKMAGAKGAFSSNEGSGGVVPDAHKNGSFKKDLKAFTSAFLKGGTSQNVIDNFVNTMKKNYGITVTVK